MQRLQLASVFPLREHQQGGTALPSYSRRNGKEAGVLPSWNPKPWYGTQPLLPALSLAQDQSHQARCQDWALEPSHPPIPWLPLCSSPPHLLLQEAFSDWQPHRSPHGLLHLEVPFLLWLSDPGQGHQGTAQPPTLRQSIATGNIDNISRWGNLTDCRRSMMGQEGSCLATATVGQSAPQHFM